MSSRPTGPQPLSSILGALAKKIKKVDLQVIDQIVAIWPTIVNDVIAEHCHPTLVKDGTLIVSVPSGAFARLVATEQSAILEGLRVLGDGAPTSLRTVIKT